MSLYVCQSEGADEEPGPVLGVFRSRAAAERAKVLLGWTCDIDEEPDGDELLPQLEAGERPWSLVATMLVDGRLEVKCTTVDFLSAKQEPRWTCMVYRGTNPLVTRAHCLTFAWGTAEQVSEMAWSRARAMQGHRAELEAAAARIPVSHGAMEYLTEFH